MYIMYTFGCGQPIPNGMEVLKTTAISEKAAAKLLKKFVDSKEEEENTDLMVRSLRRSIQMRRRNGAVLTLVMLLCR